jgi:hypothetical protein
VSASRLLSLIAILIFVAGVVLTVQAGIATSNVVSSPKAALDQHERHTSPINLSAAAAEQARLEYRQGEWLAGTGPSARTVVALDQHDRHSSLMNATNQPQMEYRRGEWYAGSNTNMVVFDVEQTRLAWRPSKEPEGD